MVNCVIKSAHGEPFVFNGNGDTAYPIASRERPPQGPTAAAAFSGVDLLTVTSVLAVMALLLTSALARTRVPDQAFQCRNNMRQLMQGWRMYAEDNSDKLPNCFDWVYGTLNYNAGNVDNTNINNLVNGLLGRYVKDVTVYKCHADMSSAMPGLNRLPRVRSVSMSHSFCESDEGWLEIPYPGKYRHYLKSMDMVLPGPANLWVLIDENPDSVNDAAFGVKMDPYGWTWQDGPSPLHDGGCGFAFGDGHCELKKWKDRRTLAIKVTYTTPVSYGVNQPSNSDIMWLQDRTTAPKL